MTDTIRFTQLVKHGRLAFAPGPAYSFEDEDAAPYFIAMGWAEATTDPADFTITLGEVDIDPLTIFADGPSKGGYVLPERAGAALNAAAALATQEA